MLRFGPEVRLTVLDERGLAVLQAACHWSLQSKVDVLVESIRDAATFTDAAELDRIGIVVDLTTAGAAPADLTALANFCTRWLYRPFVVLLERERVRVEYDVVRHRPPG